MTKEVKEVPEEDIPKQICDLAQTVTERCANISEKELAKKMVALSEALQKPESHFSLGHLHGHSS